MLAQPSAERKGQGPRKIARHIGPHRIAPFAPELVEGHISIAEVVYRQFLLVRHVGAVMLLGDAEKRRLDLRASHSRFRPAAHPLDGLVEQGRVAAKRVWKIELLAPVRVARSARSLASGRRRHANRQFLAANDLADRQLHRIAEIDRNRQGAFAMLQRGSEGQQISDARDNDRNGMNIHAFDAPTNFCRAKFWVHVRFLRLVQKDADGVE